MTLPLVKLFGPDRRAVDAMPSRIAACLSKGSVKLFETNPTIDQYADKVRQNAH
ncbi:hypothetical protein [Mesorhizobium sp. LNJC405B00]|uniref:hypothetical protein n=1 Tax=Mesorhizobium sp. LNJC405B00 TaxID=1287281 RepID=UPI0018DE1147|nr:hypothetical protein [Mesorhizobium sp. LNJC405B00]